MLKIFRLKQLLLRSYSVIQRYDKNYSTLQKKKTIGDVGEIELNLANRGFHLKVIKDSILNLFFYKLNMNPGRKLTISQQV